MASSIYISGEWTSSSNGSQNISTLPIALPDGTSAAPSLTFVSSTSTGFYKFGTNQVGLGGSNDNLILSASGTTGILFGATYKLAWNSDTFFGRDGASGVLAQANAANAQTLRIYGTTTGPKYLSLSHDGTNGVIDTAASSGLLSIGPTNATSIAFGKAITAVSGVTTTAFGVDAIVGENISGTQTSNFTALSYTPASVASRYEVSAVLTSTSSTNTGTLQLTVDYVDSQGTVHTGDIIFISGANAAPAATQTGASKEWHSLPWKISINNAGTAIVLKVVASGTVSYTVSPTIKRIA